MAAPDPLGEDGARRILEQCWPDCFAQARRHGRYYVVSVLRRTPAGTANPHAPPVEERSPLGFADAIDALAIRMPSHVALPWSESSLPMTYDEERDFLRRLVTEEFSPEAVVDRRDELQNTVDESAHHVYLHGALVYSISEQHV